MIPVWPRHWPSGWASGCPAACARPAPGWALRSPAAPPTDLPETAMERDQASKFINDLRRLLVARNGSDLFLTADFPPAIKVDGKGSKVSPQPLTGAHTVALARAIMNDRQSAEFERTK